MQVVDGGTLKSKKEVNKSKTTYQRARSLDLPIDTVESEKRNYIQKRNYYKSRVHKTKLKNWMDFVSENSSSDPWRVVYKLVMDKISVTEALSSITVDDNQSETYKDSLCLLSSTLLPREDVLKREEWQKFLASENDKYINQVYVSNFSQEDLG